MGVGKSCLINGFATALSDSELVKDPLRSFRSDGHVTVDYSGKTFNHLLQDSNRLENLIRSNIKLKFWDTWGTTSSQDKVVNFRHFLEGRVPSKAKIESNYLSPTVKPKLEIHSVIFMVSAAAANDEALLQQLEENVTIALQKGYRPLLVVNCNNFFSEEKDVEQNQQVILKKSTLSRKDVFFFDNYSDEKFRNMVKDIEYFSLLKESYLRAVNYFRSQSGGVSVVKPIPIAKELSAEITLYCSTSGCSNHQKVVTTPRCPFCGHLPQKKRVCNTDNCQNRRNQVDFPRCPFCGQEPS